MSRWWRAYEEAATDPKLQLLNDGLFRAWFNIMCIASKNDGQLPPLAHVAYTLQIKPDRAAQIITQLCGAGLLDKTETGFVPHNWNGRQYKSDVTDPTAADRMKRYRSSKRNDRNATVTPLRPETETEQRQKDSEANASGADAPRDVRFELFNRGLETLARLTGKGPDACRSFVGKCLKAASDDAVTVLGLIEDADRNRVADPSSWISARLKATGPPSKPLTEHQRAQHETKDILDELDNFARGSGKSRQADIRLLPDNSGERPEGVRGGPGQDTIELSAGRGRASG